MARTKRKTGKPRTPKLKTAPQESPDPVKISVRLDPRLIQWAKLHAVQTASTSITSSRTNRPRKSWMPA
jgi:hypothetical protein